MGKTRFAGALVLIALGLGVATPATSAAGSADATQAGKKPRAEILGARQDAILAKGVKVELTAPPGGKPRSLRVRLASSSFDTAAFVPIASRQARARPARGG